MANKEKRGKRRTLNNMKVSLAAEERIIEALRARVQKQEKKIEGLLQLVECVDATLKEIAIKYGDPVTEKDKSVCWDLDFPSPDISKLRYGQVKTAKEGDKYRVCVFSDETMDELAEKHKETEADDGIER